MRYPLALLWAMFSTVAIAQNQPDDPAMERVERDLEAVLQEQHAVFQQFQMIQALQQSEIQSVVSGQPPLYVPEGQFPSYEDQRRAKDEQQQRLSKYSSQLEELYARYRDLGEQSSQLVRQMQELAQQRR